jgi:hypothetical protein
MVPAVAQPQSSIGNSKQPPGPNPDTKVGNDFALSAARVHADRAQLRAAPRETRADSSVLETSWFQGITAGGRSLGTLSPCGSVQGIACPAGLETSLRPFEATDGLTT